MIIRYGMNNVGDDVSSLKVVSENPDAISNATTHGPPDLLLIDIPGMDNHSDEVKTLSYSFKGEVKVRAKIVNSNFAINHLSIFKTASYHSNDFFLCVHLGHLAIVCFLLLQSLGGLHQC